MQIIDSSDHVSIMLASLIDSVPMNQMIDTNKLDSSVVDEPRFVMFTRSNGLVDNREIILKVSPLISG